MPLQAKMLRRQISTGKPSSLDEINGTAVYTITSASIDSYHEVVDPRGMDDSRFEKNAPLLDSHNSSSVGNVLGTVKDCRLVGRSIVATFKFAIDVPENDLARKAWAMMKSGYLPACSIGFIPTKICRPGDTDWREYCQELGLGGYTGTILCIYQQWQLTEVSLCAVPANPDAVVKDADHLRWPALRSALKSSAPQPAPSEPMSKKSFIDTFTGLTAPSVKQAADNLESARRGQSEAGLYRASALMRLAMARERRVSVHEMADQILADGLIREYLDVLPRFVCGVGCHGKNYDLVRKSLTPGAGLGGGLLPIDVSKSIFDLVGINGVYRHLGVVEMTSMETKIGQATANSAAIWITPTSMGAAIPADTSLTGTSLTPEANTIAILLRVSRELLQDEKANLSFYLLTRFAEGIAAAFDFASLQGTGANDQVSGSQTGIWNDNTIATATAAQGNNAIGQLARADFLAAVAAVSPAALQRECKWFISSSFIAPLMALVDTQGREYLLKTPAETGDGTWRLVGFEVVWAAQAPAVNQPGSIIAAFGHGPSYQVGIRTELEVMLRDSTSGFQSNEQSFRALGRGFCQTRAASGLAKLALAPA